MVVVIVPVLAIGLLGYVLAGVIGKVFAEVIIDATLAGGGLAPRRGAAPDVRSPPSGAAGGIARRPIRSRRTGRPACRSRSPSRTRCPTMTPNPNCPSPPASCFSRPSS